MADLVLVTGADGFIGKHVALLLLRDGYRVRATVQAIGHGHAVRATLAAHGADPGLVEFEAADLTGGADWDAIVAGCRYVQHIASPFPLLPPRHREALVPAARGGALAVLEAALRQDVERLVMTSSLVAMMYRAGRAAQTVVGEADWSDPEWRALSAYIVSKTRAERAAWAAARERGAETRLTTINPGLVLGPPLDARVGASLGILKMVLMGENPALAPTAHPVVDVRDVAALHVKAMTTPAAGGRRLIAAADTLSIAEMADILRAAFPDRAAAIPRMVLPDLAVRAMAMFMPALRPVVPDLGVAVRADAQYVSEMTGVSFRPAREAVVAAARALIEHGAT